MHLNLEVPSIYTVMAEADLVSLVESCLLVLPAELPAPPPVTPWVLTIGLLFAMLVTGLRFYLRSLSAAPDLVALRRQKRILSAAAPGLLPKLRGGLAKHPLIELHPAEKTAVHMHMVPSWLRVARRRQGAAKKVLRELDRLDSLDPQSRRIASRLTRDLAAESSRQARALVAYALWRQWRSLRLALLLFVLWTLATYLIAAPLLRDVPLISF